MAGAVVAQAEISATDDFSARLSLALQACNLSRAQLSSALGVNKSLVSRWLSGEMKPTSYNLARISAFLDGIKPGFNMTLWTAPQVEFDAVLGLSSLAAVTIETAANSAARLEASRQGPAERAQSALPPQHSGMRITLLAAGTLAVLALIGIGVARMEILESTSDHTEAARLTQAAHALSHERNAASVAKAEQLLRQAVATDPSYAPAWAELGFATWFPWWWAEQKNPGAKLRLKAESLAYIRRSLTISPDLAEARGIMGMVLNDTNDGARWLESAALLDANDSEIWMWLADARDQQDDLRGALDALKSARALDPAWQRLNDPYLSHVFRLQGPGEAYRELDRISGTMNDQNWPLQMRAEMKYDEGRLAESASLAAEALRAHPQNPYWARNRLVFIAAVLGDKALQDRMLAEQPSARANFDAYRRPGWPRDRAQAAPETWWDGTLMGSQAAQLVSEGNAKLLVSLYDRRFKNPSDFVSHCPCNAISTGPSLIIALRRVGRLEEAQLVLMGLTNRVRKLESAGDQLLNTEVERARLAALAGDTSAAKQRLRNAISRGWKGQAVGLGTDPASDPAFESLRGDPEFRDIEDLFRQSLHDERQRLAQVNFSGL